MAGLLPKILKRKKKKPAKSPRHLGGSATIPLEADLGGKKEAKKAKEPGVSDIASGVLINPRITEKTNLQAEKGVYAFNVAERANKVLIKRAVEELYDVGVEKVRVSNMPAKRKFIRGRRGRRPGYKKALVYLKQGNKIEFV